MCGRTLGLADRMIEGDHDYVSNAHQSGAPCLLAVVLMPALRSRVDHSDSAGFVFRSELPVSSRRAMLPFFIRAIQVKRSLDANIAADGGVLWYELVADIGATTFRVDSAWRDHETFSAWVGGDVHRVVMASLGPRVEGGTFETEVRTPTPKVCD